MPSLLADPTNPFIHRDLSWLQFNERVLAEARQSSKNPLLERLKFLAITCSNLDEFFAIRVASLGRSIQSAERHSLRTKAKQLQRVRASILEQVAKFTVKQVEAYEAISSELRAHGIHLVRSAKKTGHAEDLGRRIFTEQILPKLETPETFTPSKVHSLGNLQMAFIWDERTWLKIPAGIPNIFWAFQKNDQGQEEYYLFFLDRLLLHHLPEAYSFSGSPAAIRLCRDGDYEYTLETQDSESIPDFIKSRITSRDRGKPVRLQYFGQISPELRGRILNALHLDPAQEFMISIPLCMHGAFGALKELPERYHAAEALAYQPSKPVISLPFQDSEKMFETIKKWDLLLHHPYDSFDAYTNWITQACKDPHVISIEQTIYRTDALSPMMSALKKAAAKKRIRVVIELRARFDELNNLRLAEELRSAGVEVGFGFGNLKLHAKVALVTRVENGQPYYYSHLSTGNYHPGTARQYTDLAILTSDQKIGSDARNFFDSVWRGEIPTSFQKLLSAPSRLHRRMLHYIESETKAAYNGKPARIFAKVNALVDEMIIDCLYRASQAGVKVDLLVRGACSLIPGVPGLSDNIRVISVVDKYLEHSRIYWFASSETMYLSSADWMPRNFFSRLELAFPVTDPRLYRYLAEVLVPLYLSDNAKAKELTPQGTWKKIPCPGDKTPVRCQLEFEKLANSHYLGTPLDYQEILNPGSPRASG